MSRAELFKKVTYSQQQDFKTYLNKLIGNFYDNINPLEQQEQNLQVDQEHQIVEEGDQKNEIIKNPESNIQEIKFKQEIINQDIQVQKIEKQNVQVNLFDQTQKSLPQLEETIDEEYKTKINFSQHYIETKLDQNIKKESLKFQEDLLDEELYQQYQLSFRCPLDQNPGSQNSQDQGGVKELQLSEEIEIKIDKKNENEESAFVGDSCANKTQQ